MQSFRGGRSEESTGRMLAVAATVVVTAAVVAAPVVGAAGPSAARSAVAVADSTAGHGAAAVAGPAATAGTVLRVGTTTASGAAGVATGGPRDGDGEDPAPANVSARLQDRSGTVEAVVRLVDPGPAVLNAPSDAAVRRALRDHARRTQRPLEQFASARDGVTVVRSFWITNAVVLRVDTETVPLSAVARVRNVDRLHANVEFGIPEPAGERPDGTRRESGRTASDRTAADSTTDATASPSVMSSGGFNTTYGLDQVNATEVWAAYGTRGGGVKVAVLDTGVNESHADIDLFTRNASNETFPGGWAEFNSSGGMVHGSTPHDTDRHGTHTSGTVSGGNASGEFIGVAPNVDLMHGLVLPGGSGTFSQIVSGMEWAVNNDADVISMSLGGPSDVDWKDPIENAQAAGTVVVAAAGNGGNGTSDSPGNIYESVTAGATDANNDVTSFSSGEVINDSEFSTYPAEWPSSYVVPDVAAPGDDVKSSVPDGYTELDGTSMATPHVAGTLALMLAVAGGNLSVGEMKEALYATAWKPAGEPSGNDTRYGTGIVDAKAAVDVVAADSGVEGTVENESGAPVDGAVVETDAGLTDTTNATGFYSVVAENGTTNVTADAFGLAAATHTVVVPNGSVATQNFTLSAALEGQQTDGMAGVIEAGEATDAAFDVVNADNVTVTFAGDYAKSDANLTVNGTPASFGTPVALDGSEGTVTVRVTTTRNTTGNYSTNVTFEGEGSSLQFSTGTTRVFADLVEVAVLDTASGSFGDDVASVLDSRLPARYDVTQTTDDEILGDLEQYDVVVVQQFPASDDQFVREFVDRTDTPETGVVYLDQWGSASNAIDELANDTGVVSTTADAFDGTAEQYRIRKNHTVFDGVGSAGDNVSIHDGGDGDRAWFTGYRGTVLAEVAEGTVDGDGVGVDPTNRTVLLSSNGRNSFTNGDFTADSNRILENAVVYAADDPPTIDVTGTVEESDGTAAADDTVELTNRSERDTTNATGAFHLEPVNRSGHYDLAYAQANTSASNRTWARDESPDLYALGRIAADRSHELGTVTLPTAYVVDVRVVDEHGDPVEDATVVVRHHDGGGVAVLRQTTAADGKVYLGANSESGVELVGNVTLAVDPPESPRFTGNRSTRTLTVTENTSVNVTLEESNRVRGRVEEADGSPAAHDDLHVDGVDVSEFELAVTDGTGRFNGTVDRDGTYDLALVQVNESSGFDDTERDGSPDTFVLDRVTIERNLDVGNVTLPAGHLVNVSVVNESGDAVPNVSVTVAHRPSYAPDAIGRLHLETSADGLLRPNPDVAPGVELTGPVEVRFDPPDDSGLEPTTRELNVTGDRNLTVTLQEANVVSGRVELADGSPAVEDDVLVAGVDVAEAGRDATNSTGDFAAGVVENGTYDVVVAQRNETTFTETDRDGSPDAYTADRLTVTDDVDVGTVTLPSAYLVNVSVVNESGDAIPNVSVAVAHRPSYAPNATAGVFVETNGAGLIQPNPDVPPGVELVGAVRMTFRPEEGSGYADATRELNVTTDRRITVTLNETSNVTGRVTDANGTGLAEDVVTASTRTDLAVDLTDAGGNYTVPVEAAGKAGVAYFQRNETTSNLTDRDGVADTYFLGMVNASDDVDLGTDVVPDGFVVNVSVVNESGVPVEDASVLVAPGGSSVVEPFQVGLPTTTTADGLVDPNHDSPPGIELRDNVTLVVERPTDDDRFVNRTYTRNVTITGPDTLTFTLEESRPYNVTTGTATNVTDSSATLNGNLTGLGGASEASAWVVYWEQGEKNATRQSTAPTNLSAPGNYSADVSGLSADTTYVFHARANNSEGVVDDGATRTFTTDGLLGLTGSSNVAGDGATGSSHVVGDGATLSGGRTDFDGASSAVYVTYWQQGNGDATLQSTTDRAGR